MAETSCRAPGRQEGSGARGAFQGWGVWWEDGIRRLAEEALGSLGGLLLTVESRERHCPRGVKDRGQTVRAQEVALG